MPAQRSRTEFPPGRMPVFQRGRQTVTIALLAGGALLERSGARSPTEFTFILMIEI